MNLHPSACFVTRSTRLSPRTSAEVLPSSSCTTWLDYLHNRLALLHNLKAPPGNFSELLSATLFPRHGAGSHSKTALAEPSQGAAQQFESTCLTKFWPSPETAHDRSRLSKYTKTLSAGSYHGRCSHGRSIQIVDHSQPPFPLPTLAAPHSKRDRRSQCIPACPVECVVCPHTAREYGRCFES